MTGWTLDDNWIPVPKDVARKSASMGFSAQEQKVFWFIIEKTLGYEKAKDAQHHSIRVTKWTLAPSFFEKSIGVPQRTVRDALNSFKERKIIYLTKAPFPDRTKKMQGMTTVEINLNTNHWTPKAKKRAIIGWSIKDILNPKPDTRELQSVLDRIEDGSYQYAKGETYELTLPDGTVEEFGEDLYHAIARLNPFHPELETYYQDDSGFEGDKEAKQQWTLGFQLYEKQTLIAEACWNHKDKLIDIAKQGETRYFGILDMVLIKECKYCRENNAGSGK
ncbi:unnamed protein product [marine sediment metagenome]|uniref:Uncharacterized protein n=1 Tax=marine sediment metagenome TaxID=412755 RepID=X1LL67_9ZZZZ